MSSLEEDDIDGYSSDGTTGWANIGLSPEPGGPQMLFCLDGFPQRQPTPIEAIDPRLLQIAPSSRLADMVQPTLPVDSTQVQAARR